MNNAAMSGTHYPLDKEPRGRNEDEDSTAKEDVDGKSKFPPKLLWSQ